MKNIKLHEWFACSLLIIVFISSCSKKIIDGSTITTADAYEASANNNSYSPPAIITLTDENAKTNKDGELFYDDAHGYRYWRYSDGKYYLDKKYGPAGTRKIKAQKNSSDTAVKYVLNK